MHNPYVRKQYKQKKLNDIDVVFITKAFTCLFVKWSNIIESDKSLSNLFAPLVDKLVKERYDCLYPQRKENKNVINIQNELKAMSLSSE